MEEKKLLVEAAVGKAVSVSEASQHQKKEKDNKERKEIVTLIKTFGERMLEQWDSQTQLQFVSTLPHDQQREIQQEQYQIVMAKLKLKRQKLEEEIILGRTIGNIAEGNLSVGPQSSLGTNAQPEVMEANLKHADDSEEAHSEVEDIIN